MDFGAWLEIVVGGSLEAALAGLRQQPGWATTGWGQEPGQGAGDWRRGTTALHLAAAHGRLELLRRLRQLGAPLDARCGDPGSERTALQDSYEWGQPAATELLLELGAHYDIGTAAARGDFERVDALLAKDPQLVNDSSSGLAPLGWAGFGQDAGMVAHLVAAGAELGEELGCPCQTGNASIVEAFLACGADPNRLGAQNGLRPLHLAAQLRYSCDTSAVVRLLLQGGADRVGRTADGQSTPQDVARRTLAQARAQGDGARVAGARRVLSLLDEG